MAVYETLTEPDTVTYNGPNATINMVDPTSNSTPGSPIEVEFRYVPAGDADNDGTMDTGDYFEVSWDGGVTWETATVTYNFDPNAASDSELMVFEIADGTQYVYNNGVPGDTTGDPSKQPGGEIAKGHAQNGSILDNNDTVICFLRGTMIDTQNGQIAVEDLSIGDRVATLANGVQPVTWVGSTKRAANKVLSPIRIKAGALGENTPSQDLLVSPAHRLVVSGWRSELLFGEPETLVAAKSLVNDDTITVAHDLKSFEYFHIMFDNHEIVMSNGAPSESFQPTAESLTALDEATRSELLELFPELANSGKGTTAMPVLTDAEAALLH